MKAIRYKSIDEALRIARQTATEEALQGLFDDAGEEPQGLLSVIPEDRLPEEIFYRLFDARQGVLVDVVRIDYSGYGPPAEEADYMGFAEQGVAYILTGCQFPIEIKRCPQGARDIYHLEAMVLDRQHPLNRSDLARRLGLSDDWGFEDLFRLISARERTAEELDRLIHQGIQ